MASSKYVLENGNKENDNLTRKGLSAVHKKVKRAKKVKEVLQNDETKEALMNWLFKNEGENPLKDI